MAEQKSLIPGAIGNDHDQGFGELRDRKPEGMVLCGSFPHSMLRTNKFQVLVEAVSGRSEHATPELRRTPGQTGWVWRAQLLHVPGSATMQAATAMDVRQCSDASCNGAPGCKKIVTSDLPRG